MSKSDTQVLDFQKICRLCLVEKRSMSSIFSKKKSDKKVPLPIRIMTCASLELYEGDGLPASICSRCLTSVNQSFAFREQCEQADSTLRQYAQQMNNETSTTSVDDDGSSSAVAQAKTNVTGEASTKTVDREEVVSTKHSAIKMEESVSLPKSSADDQQHIKAEENTRQISLGVYHSDSPAEVRSDTSEERSEKEMSDVSKKESDKPTSDLLNILASKAGLTITKRSKVKQVEKSSDRCEGTEITIPTTGLGSPRGDSEETLKLLKNLCRNSQLKVKTKQCSVKVKDVGVGDEGKSDEKKKNVTTTAEFFKEYAAGTDKLIVPSNSDKNDRVYCKECKVFIGRPYFYNHVKYVHKKVRNHLCQDCGYRAHTGHILRAHIEAQHSGTVLPCNLCSLTFKCAKRLKLHMNKRHSGKPVERKHVCQYCGNAFLTPHYLKNHIRIHTHETPFHCQFCDRKFKFKWACKTHERLHTGVKPYKCTFCGEAFTQNCVRKNHEYRFHGNEEFNPKNRKPKQGPNSAPVKRNRSRNVHPIDLVEVVTTPTNDFPWPH